jgi:glycosyltransferase involved in cell wall biosynthesis
LNPVKEQSLFIKAVSILLKRNQDVAALIVGSSNPPDDTGYEQMCRDLAKKLGVANCVHFLGHRSDIAEILLESTAFVFPSWQEGMALALMEAMESRCIVVAAAIHSSCELIQDGWNGFLTPIGDEYALASTIDHCLALTPKERETIGERAHHVIAERYDRAEVMKLFDPIFLSPKNC